MIPTQAQIDALHELGIALDKTDAEIKNACRMSRADLASIIIEWRRKLDKKERIDNDAGRNG